MRQSLANLACGFLVGGCSLIYNPNNITKAGDASIDSPPDVAIDANASALTLTEAFPKIIDEGQGDGGSRRQILVIHGTNFVSGAQVSLSPTSAKIDVDNLHIAISAASDLIAVPLTAHVDTSVGEGNNVPISITVTQPAGGTMISKTLDGNLSLHHHDELMAAPSGMLAPLYSQITFAAPITITAGTTTGPYRLRAVASISIGDITAKGGNGSGTTGGAAGPNACAGAAAKADAGCAPGGGKGGATPGIDLAVGGDGGGAGFSTDGMPGTGGTGPGAGGSMIGDDMVVSYTANKAPGGGGGGGSGITGSGGSGGGGGGGTIEVSAGGTVAVGTIDVSGGIGANATGGGGGGGAGGVIVLKTGATITATMLKAPGGGGAGGSTTDGKGSSGRIRWDAPSGTMPTGVPMPMRGPSFAASTQLVIKTPSVQLVGTPNRRFDVYWVDAQMRHNDGAESGTAFDASGLATITPPIQPGWNQICIVMMGGSPGTAEAEKCIDVAYLP